jgi:hypothetical protein
MTVEYSFNLLKNHSNKLGNQYYIILEELFYASLDLYYLSLAKVLLNHYLFFIKIIDNSSYS